MQRLRFPQPGRTRLSLAYYHCTRFMRSDARSHRPKNPLRLMPLGGSVTYGSESSDGNGYRQTLRQMLISSGYQVNMVGSRKAGKIDDNHEGWRGFRIDQIHVKANRSVAKFRPHLFTVNAGSNDCIQDFKLDEAGKRMGDMLEYLWTVSPDSTVLLSTLLVNSDPTVESRVLRVNEQFRDLGKQKMAKQKKILLVEMHGPDGPQLTDLADGTHPNDLGYSKMAKIWYRGIQEAASKGFLKAILVDNGTLYI